MTSRVAMSIPVCFALLILVGCYATRAPGDGQPPSTASMSDPGQIDAGPAAARFVPALRPESDYAAFPGRVQVDGESLVLNGSGLCEWGFLGIDLYRAALYVAKPGASLDDVLAGSSRVVFHLHFVRSLTREQLVEAYTASVRANAGQDFPGYESALDQLCDALSTVNTGDSLTFVVEPQSRIEVFANQDSRGVIEDARFARLFPVLYLGDQPPTQDLKDALLGRG